MKLRLAAVVLCCLAMAGGLGAADREYRQTFAVEPGVELVIETNRADILVEESDLNEVRVVVTVDAVAENDALAERLLQNVQVKMEARDRRVLISARNLSESGVQFTWSEDNRADVGIVVTVPRQCDVDIKTISGRVTVGSLSGRMKTRVEQGNVFFRRIDGSVHAEVDFGDLIVSRCTGPVTAKLLRGAMRLGTIGGRAELSNATGDIEVMVVRHSLEAKAQAGDVRVGFAPGQAADSRVRVSGGSIVADFAAATACRVDAAATWGSVKSNLPLTIESGRIGERSLRGRLNEGGPLVELRASGGSVTLRPNLEVLD